MNKERKTIGVWGFGKVGASALNYFVRTQNNIKLSLLEKRALQPQEVAYLQAHKIKYFKESNKENNSQKILEFLEQNDLILPSPGIDLSDYKKYKNKFISELDIFAQQFLGNTIGITGSVGKTSIVHLLSQILTQISPKQKIFTGGNIGTPLLEIFKKKYDTAILELSSFQLELSKQFAPDLAIWTNFYPNHLDRHKSLKNYFNAKLTIILHQTGKQKALLPLGILHKLPLSTIQSRLYFFAENKPPKTIINKLRKEDTLFYADGKDIIKKSFAKNTEEKIGDISQIDGPAHFIFRENILIIFSSLYLVNRINKLSEAIKLTPNLEHRLEKLNTHNNIEFYNDSKSTTPASTLAAVKKLSQNNKPIILLLGGVSKGVDRSPFVQELRKISRIKNIISFGKEAKYITALCKKNNISCVNFDTLEAAIKQSYALAKPSDSILFSPAGASFDLFKNYIERGNRFKEIVLQIAEN